MNKKLIAILAIVVAVIAIPAVLLAWGPARKTYTMDKPAGIVTFNSITDNKNFGDERNFVGITENGTTNPWSDSITVKEGKSYTVHMYVHNNAAEELGLVAHDVKARFNLPKTAGKSIDVVGFINSSNATPIEIYDDATFTSDKNFTLAYKSGSLKYENRVFGTAGAALSENIFTNVGEKLGYDKLDGDIPGCLPYSGYVTFTVIPRFAETSSFTMSKKVSKHGANRWDENYTAQPGEVVDYLISYQNTSDLQQNNVTLRDTLPVGVTYVKDSTILGNAKYPAGTPADNNIANGIGINAGPYAGHANAWVIFSATVPSNDKLKDCGNNTLVNKATVIANNTPIEDTANVTVTKTCTPPEKPKETPKELPVTGPGESIAAFMGLGAMTTGIGYYIASRRISRK